MILMKAAFVSNDDALRKQQMDWVRQHPGSVSTVYAQTRNLLAEGRMKESRELLRNVTHMLQERGQSSLIAEFEQDAAIGFLTLGDTADARDLAHLDYHDDNSPQTVELLAFLGDTSAASSLLDAQLRKVGPQNTLWNQLNEPGVRAEILLRQNRPLEALRTLEATDFLRRDTDLMFAQARAHRALHRLSQAEADLRALVTRPRRDPNSPTITAAQLALVDVLMEEGKEEQAKNLIVSGGSGGKMPILGPYCIAIRMTMVN